MRWSVVVLTLTLTLTACGAGRDEPARDTAGEKLGKLSEVLSDSDLERVGRFERLTMRWNKSAQPVVDEFVDPKISARRWMRASRPRLRTMEDAARAFRLDVQTLEDADLGAMFGPVSRNLDQRTSAFGQLFRAVAAGNRQGQRRAYDQLVRGSREARRIVVPLLERLRPYLSEATRANIARVLRDGSATAP